MKEIPKISISFKEITANPIKSKGKGVVALILKDTENSDTIIKTFKNITEIDGFSETNKKYISDVFVGGASKVIVLNITNNNTIDKIIKQLDTLKFNYVGVLSENNSDHTKLSKYILTNDKKGRTEKGVFYKVVNLDNKHCINVINERIKFKDDRGEQSGYQVIAYLLGVFAGMPLNRSATNFKLNELVEVSNVDDIEAEQKKGNLILNFNGENVSIISGRNTLITVDTNNSEAMQSIAIVEAMDLFKEDIQENFKLYIGAYKNSYNNQMLVISSLVAYLEELEKLQVLDAEYNNSIEIDIEAVKNYWKSKGQNVDTMSDAVLRRKTCGTNVFLKADLKFLDVIENFKFDIFFTV